MKSFTLSLLGEERKQASSTGIEQDPGNHPSVCPETSTLAKSLAPCDKGSWKSRSSPGILLLSMVNGICVSGRDTLVPRRSQAMMKRPESHGEQYVVRFEHQS